MGIFDCPSARFRHAVGERRYGQQRCDRARHGDHSHEQYQPGVVGVERRVSRPVPGVEDWVRYRRAHKASTQVGQLASWSATRDDRPINKLALITGASSGIGRAFAKRLASGGYDLVIVARRTERLSELATSLVNVAVRPLVADLSTDEGIEAVAQVCSTEAVTMLVNNAGVAHYMALAELPADKARDSCR